jgi:hypothetical protein
MRKEQILCLLLILPAWLTAQVDAQKRTPTLKEMKKVGTRAVNRFQVAMRQLNSCSLIIEGTIELFTEDAIIQVSSLNNNIIKEYSREGYLTLVTGLKCGSKPRYKDFTFSYSPTSPSDGKIEQCFDGNCTMSFEMHQIFKGEPLKGQKEYCDYTIKSVKIYFHFNEKGELEAQITGIYVEKTLPCCKNENKNENENQ